MVSREASKHGLGGRRFHRHSVAWYFSAYPSTHDHLLTYWRTYRAKGRALPELRARDSGWRVLEGRPQGCLHCGLLLLRASTFLRVVVCGSNLDGQLERDRDALFVQDRGHVT